MENKYKWQAIGFPNNATDLSFERIRGFSIASDNVLAVISSEAIHIVDLKNVFLLYDYYRYPDGKEILIVESRKMIYDYRDFMILSGDFYHENFPLLKSKNGESIHLDENTLQFSILADNGDVSFEQTLEHDGDWILATFSSDGDYVVISSSSSIKVLKRVHCLI